MKYKYLILSIVLLPAIFLSSCSEEMSRVDTDHGPLQFELNLKGGTPILHTRAVTNDMVFVFVYNASDEAKPVIQLKDELEGENTILYYTPADNFIRSASYNIFTVATADIDLQMILESPMSEKDLLDLIQNKTDLDIDGNGYIVSGGLKGVTFNNSSKTINLFRNICRLELTVTDQTTNKYKSIEASFDAPDRTYIFSSDIRNEAGMPVGTTDNTNQIAFKSEGAMYKDTCYFFENTNGLTLKMQATGIGEAEKDTTFNYEIVLEKTVRNTIYRVNAGLNQTGLTVTTSAELDWKENIDDNQELTPENP